MSLSASPNASPTTHVSRDANATDEGGERGAAAGGEGEGEGEGEGAWGSGWVGAAAAAAAAPRSFEDYLRSFSVTREQRAEGGVEATNTRIGCRTLGIFGGTYHVPEARYAEFLRAYYEHVFVRRNPEFLTEKQLETGGIAVDLDFRYDISVKTRQHNEDVVLDIMVAYLDQLKTIFSFAAGDNFPIFVCEKPHVNCVPEKNLTKDGIHLVIGLQADRATQVLLRKQVMAQLDRDIQTLPLRCSWSDVLDEAISKGHVNWQLFGSGKPGNERYGLTGLFRCTYDAEDGEFEIVEERQPAGAVLPF